MLAMASSSGVQNADGSPDTAVVPSKAVSGRLLMLCLSESLDGSDHEEDELDLKGSDWTET